MVEVSVSGVALDSITNMPIIILKDKEERELPIWVGLLEAQSILFALEGIMTPRPMTHDLLKDILINLGGELKRVIITHISDNTYYAKLIVSKNGGFIEIDSRPSDGIALALRTNSPIFVDKSIKFINSFKQTPISDEEVLRFKEELKNLNPSDFL
ncbi:MAG: bifunctional nuclease family protein [bacterium]